MTIEERFNLIKEVGEEILTENELLNLLSHKKSITAYDGFEPSGLAPIHFGLLRAINVKKLLEAGVHFKLWLADYFAYINNKMGGDMDKIRRVGDYFVEVWKASGIDTSKIEIVWASEKMNKLEYWDRVLTIARHLTLNRSFKSLTIAGRSAKEKLSTAQLFYTPMQVADIFELNVDICQLGMDQRRANVIAREISQKLGWKKPVAVHHHMLMGLKGIKKGDSVEDTMIKSKMSKSDPSGAIYVHDTKEEIEKKIKSAYCPPKEIQGNPMIEFAKYLIFPSFNIFKIYRSKKHGGYIEFNSIESLNKEYMAGTLHPNDLKIGVAAALEILIKPIREYFEKNKKAGDLYQEVKSYQVTR